MNLRLAPLALLLAVALPALAERADRDKPMLLEANRMSIDDAKKVQILEGDVVVTKGTMLLKADRVVITEDKYGFQKVTPVSTIAIWEFLNLCRKDSVNEDMDTNVTKNIRKAYMEKYVQR